LGFFAKPLNLTNLPLPNNSYFYTRSCDTLCIVYRVSQNRWVYGASQKVAKEKQCAFREIVLDFCERNDGAVDQLPPCLSYRVLLKKNVTPLFNWFDGLAARGRRKVDQFFFSLLMQYFTRSQITHQFGTRCINFYTSMNG